MLEYASDTHNTPRSMVVLTLILGVYQILFAYHVLQDTGVRPQDLSLAPVVQSGIALVWGILFSYAAWRLWHDANKAIVQAVWLFIGFLVYRLGQALVFVQADYNRNRFVFLVAVTLMILVVPVRVLMRNWEHGTYK